MNSRDLRLHALRAVTNVSGLLSLRAAQKLGALLGDIAWWRRSRAAESTVRNLRLCLPDLDDKARQALARASLRETGKLVVETACLWSGDQARCLRWVRNVRGAALIEEPLRLGQGVLLLAPHQGNFELLNAYLGNRYRLVAMYSPPRSVVLDKFIRNKREHNGGLMLPATATGVRGQLRCLADGKLVGLMPDQVPAPASGAYAPFFGVPALTSTLMARLARRSGARVVCAVASRLPNAQGFEVLIEPAVEGIDAAHPADAARAINATVERSARRALDQYQWEYKRFKHARAGEIDYYK